MPMYMKYSVLKPLTWFYFTIYVTISIHISNRSISVLDIHILQAQVGEKCKYNHRLRLWDTERVLIMHAEINFTTNHVTLCGYVGFLHDCCTNLPPTEAPGALCQLHQCNYLEYTASKLLPPGIFGDYLTGSEYMIG